MHRPALPLLAVVLAAAGCVPKKAQTPQPASSNLVVLLPDPGKTTAGRAVVSNDKGTLDLAEGLRVRHRRQGRHGRPRRCMACLS